MAGISDSAFHNAANNAAYQRIIKDNRKLVDQFAAAALQGMLAHSRNGHGYRPRNPDMHWHDAIAAEAYELAFAMMAARRDAIGED